MSLLHGRAPTALQVTDPQEEIDSHTAKDGAVVIIQEQYTSLKMLTLSTGKHVDNRFGRFSHDDVIGRPFGRRLYSRVATSGRQSSAGFVHVLKPTPELWSQAMDHRTQIVYPHDAALISLLLDLRPGSILVESGTGSGAASAAFARVVAPGRVFSFDFHQQRADAAERDFHRLGIHNVVTVTGGIDVVKDGFVGVCDDVADAVFLDLPMPYAMGPEVFRVLHSNGVVCLFSPCIEQVQKSCQMLRSSGFHSIRTVTAPVKTYETREMKLQTPGFDELLQHKISSPESDICTDLAALKAPALSVNGTNVCSTQPCAKRVRTNDGALPISEKVLRLQNLTAGAERLAVSAIGGEDHHVGRVVRPNIHLHSRPFPTMKGHTSYLTFARKCSHFTTKKDAVSIQNTINVNPNQKFFLEHNEHSKADSNDCRIV